MQTAASPTPSQEGELIFQTLGDQITALRLAIAWLMVQQHPNESREWLDVQREEIRGNPKLVHIEQELKALTDTINDLIGF